MHVPQQGSELDCDHVILALFHILDAPPAVSDVEDVDFEGQARAGPLDPAGKILIGVRQRKRPADGVGVEQITEVDEQVAHKVLLPEVVPLVGHVVHAEAQEPAPLPSHVHGGLEGCSFRLPTKTVFVTKCLFLM